MRVKRKVIEGVTEGEEHQERMDGVQTIWPC